MSTIDDVWTSMQEGEDGNLVEYRKRVAVLKTKTSIESIVSLIDTKTSSGKSSKKKKDGITNKSSNKSTTSSTTSKSEKDRILKSIGVFNQKSMTSSTSKTISSCDDGNSSSSSNSMALSLTSGSHQPEDVEQDRIIVTATDMMAKIIRDINVIDSSDDIGIKRKSFNNVYKLLFEKYTLSNADYNEIFRDVSKCIFKKIADPAEKCREMSLKIIDAFFDHVTDFVSILGYFIPCMMKRLPPGLAYDEDMKVFVNDIEAHESYRRGKAVDRQDKSLLLTHTVVETSEELRLLGCRVIHKLIKRVCTLEASTVLHPYFHEIIMFLQLQLRDPFPDLKLEACEALSYLAIQETFVPGMVFFAVALVRAILPVLRHRHAKVRVAAVVALKSCMVVPDRAKVKGAGTEAMVDLVGFREENVLPIASFYTTDVRVNYLAELVYDKTATVREKVADMLKVFLTELGDRYDHQSRLLPYLLDLLTDESPIVSNIAMECLNLCSNEYESEHPDDIIEKRQYGIDGDERINLSKPLPKPFLSRPKIGIRLYVRGNTKRFLFALINELTNWQSKIRYKSAQLLMVVIVLCEEHLTMEAHQLLPMFIKALGFAKDDKDNQLYLLLLEVYEVVGRYMFPDTYIHYILPRLRGDKDVTQFGADTATRTTVLELLGALVDGTKPSLIPNYFEDIVKVLCDPFVIDPESIYLPSASLNVLLVVLRVMKGRGKAAIASHFIATGRLTSLKSSIQLVYATLMLYLHDKLLQDRVIVALRALSFIDTDPPGSVRHLMHECGSTSIADAIGSYEIDTLLGHRSTDHRLLTVLLESPWCISLHSKSLYNAVILFLIDTVTKITSMSASFASTLVQHEYMESFSSLLCSVIAPAMYPVHSQASTIGRYRGLLDPIDLDTAATSDGVVQGARHDSSMVDVINSNIDMLFGVFVYDGTWNQSSSLLLCRMDVVATILSASFSTKCCDSGTHAASAIVFTSTTPSIVAKTISKVIDSVVLSGKNPSNTSAVRLKSVELLHYLFDTVTHMLDCSRVISFSKQTEKTMYVDMVLYRDVFQSGIHILLDMVDDSSDAVRLSTIQCLLSTVPYIKSGLPSSSSSSSSSGSSSSGSIVYDVIVEKLILEVTNGVHTEEYLDNLDCLLRAVAVLDPTVFEAVVRKLLPELLQGVHKAPSATSDMFSGLLDHCEMMMQFNHASTNK